MQIKTYYFKVIDFSLLIILIGLTYSFISHRPMMNEGSHWYYSIIAYQHTFIDNRFFRYIDYIIQGPTVLLFYINSYFFNFNANKFAIYLLSFCWTFYPSLSLLVVRYILKKKARPELFIFPLLSFATATIATMPYAVALSISAMSVFWPLFFLILLRNNKSYLELLFIILLMFAQVLTYEPSIILFFLFIGISIWDLLRSKNNSRTFNITIIFLSMISISWLINVIINVPTENSGPFLYSLYSKLDAFRIFSGITVFIILSFIFLLTKFPDKKKYYSIILTISYLAMIGWFFYIFFEPDSAQNMYYYISPMNAFHSRATALPLTFLIAFFVFIFSLKIKNDIWTTDPIGKVIIILIFINVLTAMATDVKITHQWNRGFAHFQNFVKNNTGCVVVSDSEFKKYYNESDLRNIYLQYTGILVQILNDIYPLKSLIFTDAKMLNQDDFKNPCLSLENNNFSNYQGFFVDIKNTSLKFSDEFFINTNSEKHK